MKKTLIYIGTVFAISTIASIFLDSANAKETNIDNNLQYPTNSWRLVKHTFRLNIPQNNNALSQLIIETPSTVAVSNEIEVWDVNGQKININISVKGRQIIIEFPEKVIPNTKLLVNFNKVQQPVTGSNSVYRLWAKVVGSEVEIPIGVAQFPTF
ncbi:DUF2808 domain-containing protein [Nostoc sp. LEGE 06077]|uniref:DUF2808 domain-containing protein n=1 Tax=Nostoc sp. LEGE 06077 TaxID=915325 RepID=UPI000B5DCA34|nr:DUF2808 domain-containing protein [Nostoc sp. LEGE 06077]MBE9206066.1 DUF2808 domain-containing protein [Nostoc sp. LEGE 06077]BAZ19310.1 hypothetical protein NIES4073_01800 [Scytonema sp. NIES-4073]